MGYEGKDIRSSIKRMIGDTPYHVKICTVNKVNSESCEVEPINGDAIITEARYLIDISGKTVYKPKLGSIVAVAMFSNTAGIIIAFSEVDSITLNGSDKDGLVVVKDLVQKLNNLENKYNNLLLLLQSVVVPLAPSGSYPFAPIFASEQPLVNTQQVEIENTLVKHGTGS